jgi:hypothetical protein
VDRLAESDSSRRRPRSPWVAIGGAEVALGNRSGAQPTYLILSGRLLPLGCRFAADMCRFTCALAGKSRRTRDHRGPRRSAIVAFRAGRQSGCVRGARKVLVRPTMETLRPWRTQSLHPERQLPLRAPAVAGQTQSQDRVGHPRRHWFMELKGWTTRSPSAWPGSHIPAPTAMRPMTCATTTAATST